jgi:hypothetical protein
MISESVSSNRSCSRRTGNGTQIANGKKKKKKKKRKKKKKQT